ncbi:Stress responsive A/B Barrel Domain-containing protein [Hoeflea sp. IMCC20628]|uniref:Dabb family protein n=1 Tax=Hoeflea sp. IMCC20628 TaxID=1620421 RepID=UPI00063ADFC5|nr:Dabb family protein [Hoeflea sp. IMCC20628]AKI01978.1 Stress responsive A/B Barrel Domain-containing protein [Hoeflea sp. IMCC20628]
MIRHLVHLRFAKDTSEADKRAIYKDLGALSGHIDGVLDFQHRTNVSVEIPLVRGFDDMFWFDFADITVRDTYLEDSVHQAIGARIVAKLDGGADGVFVCDIEV